MFSYTIITVFLMTIISYHGVLLKTTTFCKNEKNMCHMLKSETNITGSLKSSNENGQQNISPCIKSKIIHSSTLNNTFSTFSKSKCVLKKKKIIKILNDKELHRHETQLLISLKDKILSLATPFDASRNSLASAACKDHTKIFLNGIGNLELWAIRMLDSSARLTSGILNGNINQFGDFDQCLAVRAPRNIFRGKYCLSYIQLSVNTNSSVLKTLFNLVQSHEAFKSDFDDPGHRVPRFSLINWGICVPSSCKTTDVEYTLKEIIRNITRGIDMNFQIKVDRNMCQTDNFITLDKKTMLVAGIFIGVILMCVFSTFYDYATPKSSQNEWLSTFSLKKNVSWLVRMEKSSDDICVIHGIRFFNALMLLLAHKSLAIFFVPYVNRTQMAECLGQPWTVIGRAASLYTDPFLLFSGTLSSYSLVGKLQQKQQLQLRNEYIGRFLRIVPPLGALILFCTFILPLLGSGPQWNLVIGHHADLCKKYWWRNLLFIHNYFGFSNMCLTHTHHLGIDTELFICSPFFILMLWKWPRNGFCILLGLAILTTAAKFQTTLVHELSNYVYFGTTIQRLFKTADYMYSFPPYRSTVYILGILLGYVLRVFKNRKLTKSQLRYGWILSTILCLITVALSAPMGSIHYKYNPIHAACYAAFAPIGWCLYFSWIVLVSHLGYKNALTDLLSWKGFQITTKLSYSMYLIQFPVFFFNIGRRRNPDYFNFLPLILNLNEIVCIIISSIVLTLLFEAPFQNIKRAILCNSSEGKISLSDTNTKNKLRE